MENKKCKAMTLKGNPCKCEAMFGDYCLRHFNMFVLKKPKKREKLNMDKCYKEWLKDENKKK
jgi:hypothetical protein